MLCRTCIAAAARVPSDVQPCRRGHARVTFAFVTAPSNATANDDDVGDNDALQHSHRGAAGDDVVVKHDVVAVEGTPAQTRSTSSRNSISNSSSHSHHHNDNNKDRQRARTHRSVCVKVVNPRVRHATVWLLSCPRHARMARVYRALCAHLSTSHDAIVCYTLVSDDDDNDDAAAMSVTRAAVGRVLTCADAVPRLVVCQLLPAASWLPLSSQRLQRWLVVNVLTTSTSAALTLAHVPLVVAVPARCRVHDVVDAVTCLCNLSRTLRDYLHCAALIATCCSSSSSADNGGASVCLAHVCDRDECVASVTTTVCALQLALVVPALMVGDVVYVDATATSSSSSSTTTTATTSEVAALAGAQGVVTRCGVEAGMVAYDVLDTQSGQAWQRLTCLHLAPL